MVDATVPTYWSVGNARLGWLASPCGGRHRRWSVDARGDPRRGIPVLRRARLRGHVPQRHRRGGRHPAARACCTTSPRKRPCTARCSADPRRLGDEGREGRRPTRPGRLGQGRPRPHRRVPVLQGEPGLRAHRAPGGARGRRPTSASTSARLLRPLFERAVAYFDSGDGGRPVPPPRPRAAHRHRATARCSATSATCRSSTACSTATRCPPRPWTPASTTSAACSGPPWSPDARNQIAAAGRHVGTGLGLERPVVAQRDARAVDFDDERFDLAEGGELAQSAAGTARRSRSGPRSSSRPDTPSAVRPLAERGRKPSRTPIADRPARSGGATGTTARRRRPAPPAGRAAGHGHGVVELDARPARPGERWKASQTEPRLVVHLSTQAAASSPKAAASHAAAAAATTASGVAASSHEASGSLDQPLHEGVAEPRRRTPRRRRAHRARRPPRPTRRAGRRPAGTPRPTRAAAATRAAAPSGWRGSPSTGGAGRRPAPTAAPGAAGRPSSRR